MHSADVRRRAQPRPDDLLRHLPFLLRERRPHDARVLLALARTPSPLPCVTSSNELMLAVTDANRISRRERVPPAGAARHVRGPLHPKRPALGSRVRLSLLLHLSPTSKSRRTFLSVAHS